GLHLLLAAGMLATGVAGCHRDGCVGGDDGQCVPPAACPALTYPICAGPKLRAEMIGDMDAERVLGPKALAAAGDYLLENDQLRVVFDAPLHPHDLAPSGGAILDLAPITLNGSGQPVFQADQANVIYHAAGVLPRDAVHYESAAILDPGIDPSAPGAYVAVVFRGHLEGDPKVTVVTRYEVRPCEPGVRVRTDVYNGAPDPNTLFLADGFFWGDNGLAPFVPAKGLGFVQPDLDLLHLDAAWREWPFLAARSQSVPDTSYAAISCDRAQGAGFNSTTLTAAGVPLGVTLPGDGFHFERFIVAAWGSGLGPAVGEAMHVRTLVHGDPPAVTVSGRVVANGVPVDGRAGRGASLLFYEPAAGSNPDDPNGITPRNEVVPASDGTFQLALPPNRSYRVQPYAFGLPAATPASFAVAGADAAIGDITVTASAELLVNVETAPNVPANFAELVLIPQDDPAATNAPTPSLYSLFPGCLPMLGPPDGAAPACNRALTANDKGQFDLAVPPGLYYVYATRGPFASIDRAQVTLASGTTTQVTLQVQSLASQILPPGVISGDFHVHGGASFDSGIPDQDRVVSFLATGVDVVIATDHNVVTSYAGTLAGLGASNALAIIPGVEQTPNILWYYVPGDTFPKTLGHFNFWPLVPDFFATRNGAPWAELREPGQLMDDMDSMAFTNPAIAVRQLNHPYLLSKLGRDQGYPKAIGYDPRDPIPETPTDGYTFAANALARAPGGPGHHRNIDWDVEEVMTGASRADWLRYRALWFSLLNQGFLRAGTANSDSHSLAIERIGYPRNLIWGNHDKANLDFAGFDADIRAGHLEGTNGPVLDVSIDDGTGTIHRPDLTKPFTVTPAATLNVTVTAAPWIPVDELRIFVNGQQVMVPVGDTLVPSVDISASFSGADHLGTTPSRYPPLPSSAASFPLAPLLPATGDAWLVVEAGMTQVTPADTDGDGLPDLPDAGAPVRPAEDNERFDVEAIAPGVWPTAFSNPFLLDLDGGGWTAPGLPP
ncbi:MAG TPA: CehA/McbA family metallohydrolase, partial [Polyangia bacterium]